MSDTPATTAALRALLLARGGDPVATAAELCDRAGRGAGTAALAELAADTDLPPRQRAVALLAVAIALADDPDAAAPDTALDAVENEETATAALDAGLAAALTGVLRAAPLDESLRATRRLIGRRCLAAGMVGPHIARLLADGGDREGAAHAAATDLGAHLDRPGPGRDAWLHLLLAWSRDQASPLFGDLIRALAAARPDAATLLADLLAGLPGAAPELAADCRARILWEASVTPE